MGTFINTTNYLLSLMSPFRILTCNPATRQSSAELPLSPSTAVRRCPSRQSFKGESLDSHSRIDPSMPSNLT